MGRRDGYDLTFARKMDALLVVNVGVSCPGGCVHTLTGHQSLTSGMELRDNVLVSGNADSTVRVWDIRTGQCLHTLQGETARSCGGRGQVVRRVSPFVPQVLIGTDRPSPVCSSAGVWFCPALTMGLSNCGT